MVVKNNFVLNYYKILNVQIKALTVVLNLLHFPVRQILRTSCKQEPYVYMEQEITFIHGV